jgi:N-acetylmuramoyl-L-alanine amidase
VPAFDATPAVRAQAQRRLASLGHGSDGAEPDDAVLSVAIQAFQRERGLTITGHLDADTWQRLIEAGWRLGDRLLYLDRPLQRGDDVAALQESLALLGFNPGRIDGIFGGLTERALAEFQRDCGLESSGVLASSTMLQLARLGSPSFDRRPVTETRGVIAMLGPARRVVVVAGDHPFAHSLRAALAQSLRVVVASDGDGHAAAALANAEHAGLLIAISPGTDGLALHYFASYRSHSTEGREFAESVAERAAPEVAGVSVVGMAVPALRESVMPAVVLEVGPMSPDLHLKVANYVAAAAFALFDRSR